MQGACLTIHPALCTSEDLTVNRCAGFFLLLCPCAAFFIHTYCLQEWNGCSVVHVHLVFILFWPSLQTVRANEYKFALFTMGCCLVTVRNLCQLISRTSGYWAVTSFTYCHLRLTFLMLYAVCLSWFVFHSLSVNGTDPFHANKERENHHFSHFQIIVHTLMEVLLLSHCTYLFLLAYASLL